MNTSKLGSPVVIPAMPEHERTELSPLDCQMGGYFNIVFATGRLLASAWNVASNSPTLAYDYCTNPNHPWKVQKYSLGLQQMGKGIEKLTNRSMSEWQTLLLETPTSLNLETIELLKDLQADQCDDKRKAYKNFIYKLREILTGESFFEQLSFKELGKPYDPSLDLLLELCTARFEEIHIYPFCDYIVFKMIKAGQNKLGLPTSENCNLCEEDFEAIDAAPRKYKAQQVAVDKYRLFGSINRWFDPQLSSNMPFVLGDIQINSMLGEQKSVRLLRIGTPTISNLQGCTSIIPEFECYIKACQTLNKKYLYVSLQSDLKGGGESELARNSVIKRLASSYPNCFFVVILAQDSDFYHQIGDYSQPNMQTKEFAAKFLDQLLSEDSGFYFSQEWRQDPNFQIKLNELIFLTLEVMFGDQPECLTIGERQDAIEICYIFLEIYSMLLSECDSCNITCTHAIDRAGKNNSLLIRFLNIAQGFADSEAHLRKHKVFTHAPALLVKKQAIIPERKERLMNAAKWLDLPNVQARIRRLAMEGLIPVDPNGDMLVKDDECQGKKAFQNESFYLSYKNQKERL